MACITTAQVFSTPACPPPCLQRGQRSWRVPMLHPLWQLHMQTASVSERDKRHWGPSQAMGGIDHSHGRQGGRRQRWTILGMWKIMIMVSICFSALMITPSWYVCVLHLTLSVYYVQHGVCVYVCVYWEAQRKQKGLCHFQGFPLHLIIPCNPNGLHQNMCNAEC